MGGTKRTHTLPITSLSTTSSKLSPESGTRHSLKITRNCSCSHASVWRGTRRERDDGRCGLVSEFIMTCRIILPIGSTPIHRSIPGYRSWQRRYLLTCSVRFYLDNHCRRVV